MVDLIGFVSICVAFEFFESAHILIMKASPPKWVGMLSWWT